MFPFEFGGRSPELATGPMFVCGCSFRHQNRLRAKSVHRAEYEIHLPGGPDAKDPVRFIAPAKEQLALITEDRFHGTPLVCVVKLLMPANFVAGRAVVVGDRIVGGLTGLFYRRDSRIFGGRASVLSFVSVLKKATDGLE
jgi:hypothetical protein